MHADRGASFLGKARSPTAKLPVECIHILDCGQHRCQDNNAARLHLSLVARVTVVVYASMPDFGVQFSTFQFWIHHSRTNGTRRLQLASTGWECEFECLVYGIGGVQQIVPR